MAIMRYLRIGDNRYEIADEKIKVSEISPGITYYPIIGNGATDTSASRQWDSTGLQYEGLGGEEEGEVGSATLSLGNDISVGEIDSKRGNLVLYGEESSYSVLQSGATGEGTGYYILLPDKQGTVALTTDIPSRTSQLTNDSGFLTSYTETDPTVPAWAKERTKPTYTAAEIGAISSVTVSRALVEGTKSATITVDGTQYDIYSRSGTITGIETTAGAHTTIDVSSGVVSFNVPTTAAHVGIKFGYTTSGNNRAVLQDSSGNLYVTQKDDNSNTTYTLSGALSSHKFTSTLTAGGSGSGTSTSEITFVAGSNVTLTDDTTNKKITIAATDTTYSSKAAASGGTDVSLVTTGEKYTWNSKTSNTGTITSVKTTAGTHTTINTTTGAVSFNVPTTAAHVGIKFGYTTSGNNRAVLQDSSGNLYVVQKDDNTDTKVTLTALTPPSSGTSYFPTFHTAVSGTTGLNATGNYYLRVMNGTTSANGYVYICAGNSTANGTAGNMIGGITLYGTGSYYTDIKSGSPTANRTITLPDKTGTVALTNDLSRYLPLTGGQITGPTTFGDSVSIDSLTAGDLIVNGNASFTNSISNATLTTNKLIYASSGGKLTSTANIAYFTGNSTASTPATYYSLHLHGATYGNTAANMISNTAGLFSFGDGGPQITFDTGATPGSGQAGALIYTDNDTAGTGVSWHFVSNQTDWNVTSKRFHARTGISIGTNLPNTTYNLYVNGTTYFNGNVNGGPYHKITTSTSAPSGGSNGDVWFVYA